MNLYIADLHFGHGNIIKHSKRSFKDAEEMDECLIRDWNKAVGDSDDVWVLGDLCYKAKDPIHYISQLNGRLHLITGNHDGQMLKSPVCRRRFESIDQMRTVNDNGKRIVLCHYPLVEWDGFFRGALHFYGHIHNNTGNAAYGIMKNIENAYNVGADIIGFTPCSAGQVVEKNREFFGNNP